MPNTHRAFRHVRPKVSPDQRAKIKLLAAENLHLLYSFVNNRKNLWQLFDGHMGAQSELSVPYMTAIKHYVMKEPKERLATYVFHHLNWGIIKALQRRRIIHIPENSKDCAYVRQAKTVFHFMGTEGRRNDSSLLHHDPDVSLLLSNKVVLKRLVSLVMEMKPRNQKLILKRFGMSGHGNGASFEELGAKFGISRVRVRQILVKLLVAIEEGLHSYAKNYFD